MNYFSRLFRLSCLLLFALLLSFPCSLQAQETFTGDRVPILKVYDQDHLLNIALPLGGIGTGTVSLGGRGELRDWEIMNVPGKGYNTVVMGNDAPFFAIYTRDAQGNSKTKALLGPLHDSEYQHMEGRPVNHHGLPRFRKANFSATYPFGMVALSDEGMLAGRVNLNTAPKEVIEALFGTDEDNREELANAIVQQRATSGGFSSIGQLLDISSMKTDKFAGIESGITVRSNVFRICSRGCASDGLVEATIECVVDRATYLEVPRVMYWLESSP